VVQLLVGVLWDGVDAGAGVRRPRIHHQWTPDVLYVEPAFDPAALAGLLSRGHTLRACRGAEAGCVQAIEIRDGVAAGVVDPRKTER
jgi:gamma-glutamyltranspeptidase/glutathione hydrolase